MELLILFLLLSKASLSLVFAPDNYDVRTAYQYCVKPVRTHQKEIDFVTPSVSMLEHRYCIQNHVKVDLSIRDVLMCDKSNDEEKILKTLTYFSTSGIVSEDCFPFTSQSECRKTCEK